MRVNTLIGMALGVVAGAVMAASSTQVSDAVTKGRSDVSSKWNKLKSQMK